MKLLRNIKKKYSLVKCSVVMLLVLVTCMLTITVPKINAEGDEDKDLGKSFYMMSSAAASYLSITQEPSSQGAGALKN